MTQDLRYERKIRIPARMLAELKFMVKANKNLFSSVYYPRQINSIYFENNTFSHFRENVEGLNKRKKIRLRWYGDLKQEDSEATLEIKRKNGELGDKLRVKVPNFSFPTSDIKEQVMPYLEDSIEIKEYFKYLKPCIITSYLRSYYLSRDKKIRLTIDQNVKYHLISHGKLSNCYQSDDLVIELKYDDKDAILESKFFKDFPFQIAKNSKYVNAVDALF